jgi:hypothetical protein
MHSTVLLKAEVKALQAANEQKKRRERKHKRRIMQGGSLSVQEGEDILQSAEVDAQVRTEVASESCRQVGSKGRQKRYGRCEKIGHNSRTCERRLDIIPVRARGARNQLQLSKGHYIGWWCSSSSNSQILVFWCVTRLGPSLACVRHSHVKYVIYLLHFSLGIY